MPVDDTIFALSSGALPAAIAILRISGPHAGGALTALAGTLPVPREATLRKLRAREDGGLLDEALTLWFPGPHSATGEDLAELHCHGGRAVVRAIERELAMLPGLRAAEPGEFTRRAFANGRIDLAQAEGLSDLLFAETEGQRRMAAQLAGGMLSRQVEGWQTRLLGFAARAEAMLDFADEDDVGAADLPALKCGCDALVQDMETLLSLPRTERLRDGIRVVLAGPPNSGKSTLFNALAEREAAIVSEIAGTTRDIIEVPVAIGGTAFLVSDTAGLHDDSDDPIEAIGIARALAALEAADIILWLGDEGAFASGDVPLIEVAARSDHAEFRAKSEAAISVSAQTGAGLNSVIARLLGLAQTLLPPPDSVALNARQAAHVGQAAACISSARDADDPLIIAEELRLARVAIDALTGRAGTEDMFDALFGKFCIGK
ncbi:MAG: tRNA uridine-5-carboxymethylaminomethyl(34) synthesis GTPase MnmE [Parasphingorhabdus sp.]|nr:tRNA uridine-5-carboxymethylaminomethyl(34) synthesis GTPase MnmE [Parasphingorhabdus sp.]